MTNVDPVPIFMDVVAFSTSTHEATDRISRTVRRSVPPGTHTLRVGLTDLVGDNWADAWKSARMTGLELSFGAATPTVDRIELRSPASLLSDRAGAAPLERGGVTRPGWYVHGGASARVEVRVPTEHAELRWALAGAGGSVDALVRVLGPDGTTELTRRAALSEWRVQRADLTPWAGATVTLEIAAEGQGTALFGDPRLLGGTERASQPDVLVYVIDALRADALHAWGDSDPQASPTVDRLALDGVWFSATFSVASWTKPVVPTLFTGMWPSRHLVGSARYTDRLPTSVPILPERMRDHGWRTATFSANPLATTLSGLDRGFDLVVPPARWRGEVGPMGAPTAGQVHQEVLAWVTEEGEEQPFFAYVHTLEVHQHYRPPFAHPDPLLAYDRAVAAADDALGRLLDDLAGLRRRRPLLVVLLSDHGESFGDHGLTTHGTGHYDSQLRVPLIFWASDDLPAVRIDAPTSVADLAPTLLALVGAEPLPDVDGANVFAHLDGTWAGRPFVPSATQRFVWKPSGPSVWSLVDPSLHKVLRRGAAPTEVYDLVADPCELHPERDRDRAALLERFRADQADAAARFASQHGAPIPYEPDPSLIEQLKALGYVP